LIIHNHEIFKEIARNPQIDWLIILLISVLVACSLVFMSYSLYNAVAGGTIQSTEPSRSTAFTKLDEKSISTVLNIYAHEKGHER
jgi:hypothetical protein